jgi:hypothetical protein
MKGVLNYAGGNIYEGYFENDFFNGKGVLYHNVNGPLKGDRYNGSFKNNKMDGFGVYFYKNGDKYEGEWKNDKKFGKGL